MKKIEKELLETSEDIKDVDNLKQRLQFSIFYRTKQMPKAKQRLVSLERLFNILKNPENLNHRENWATNSVGMEIDNTIEETNKINDKEQSLLDLVLENTIDENYSKEYFETVLPFARNLKLTEALDETEKEIAYRSGFLKRPKKCMTLKKIERHRKEKNEKVIINYFNFSKCFTLGWVQ